VSSSCQQRTQYAIERIYTYAPLKGVPHRACCKPCIWCMHKRSSTRVGQCEQPAGQLAADHVNKTTTPLLLPRCRTWSAVVCTLQPCTRQMLYVVAVNPPFNSHSHSHRATLAICLPTHLPGYLCFSSKQAVDTCILYLQHDSTHSSCTNTALPTRQDTAVNLHHSTLCCMPQTIG
jgi:hypothetical protein